MGNALSDDREWGRIDAVPGRSTAIGDVAFLTRSAHRIAALDALTERPLSRADLRATTGVSASTICRTLRDFEERHWIRKEGHRYEATRLGEFVASATTELIELIETERRLREVWPQLHIDDVGLRLEAFADAVVTIAAADDPYRPVNRFVSLLQGTDRFRFAGLELALLEPCKDEFRRRILEGMRTEIIDPPNAARHVLSTYPEHCSEALESGNLTVLLHDELPTYGLCLFDDRVGISGHNPESGTVCALIDTDASEVREWAEATYDAYHREARPLTFLAAQ